jgi:hypothetical protein
MSVESVNDEQLAARVCEAAAAFIRCPNGYNRERLSMAMQRMADGDSPDDAAELLRDAGWSDEYERDGQCWTHRCGRGTLEVEISDGEAWLSGFDVTPDSVGGLVPAELRAFALLVDASKVTP